MPAGRLARRSFVRALTVLPGRQAEDVLAVAATAWGWLVPRQRRAALRWAREHGGSRWDHVRLAGALLASRGRCLAFAMRVGVPDVAALRARVVLRGTEHLDAARASGCGALLVGFHVGPGRTSSALRAHGYAVTSSRNRSNRLRPLPVWESAAPRVGWAERPQDRALGLLRLRDLLLAGETVAITADAPLGRLAMWAPVPGGRLPLRSGWLLLRRQTGAATLPVLGHLEGPTQVVTIHPALPPPDPDAAVDRDRCQAAIAAILTDYVRRHPTQAFSVAFRAAPDAGSRS